MKPVQIFVMAMLLSIPAFADREASMDWGGLKSLYGAELAVPRGELLLDALREAEDRRPDLPVWKDAELKALLEAGDLDRILELFILPLRMTRFGLYPEGFSFQLQTRYGCLEFTLPLGSDHWILDIC